MSPDSRLSPRRAARADLAPAAVLRLARRPVDAAVGAVHGPGVRHGLAAALVVTRVFRLPPVELSGRVNLWWGLVFVLEFLAALVRGSLTVAWQVLDWRRQPGAAIIAVPLRIDDDLIMTHTAVTASLIPGSLIVDADRDRRILYLHVIGVRSDADVERHRASVLHWEARIVRAVGSRAQLERVRSCARPRMRWRERCEHPAARHLRRLRGRRAADVWRIVIGPSILDRAVASDVLLTLVMCVLGAEMAINHHTRTLPVLLIIAARRACSARSRSPASSREGTGRADGCRSHSGMPCSTPSRSS